MKNQLISPLQASHTTLNETDFYTAYPLREWAVVKKIGQIIEENACGELCSLRFTWQQPKKSSSDEVTFIYETLAGLIDAAWSLANAPLVILHIEQVPNKNNLFALAMFANEVVAEFELNECLPDSMPATHFIKANFTGGHVTNQPLVGHFNNEGSILANDSTMERLIIENSNWDDCGDEIEICERSMLYAIEHGTYPTGPLHSAEIVKAINSALGSKKYNELLHNTERQDSNITLKLMGKRVSNVAGDKVQSRDFLLELAETNKKKVV